MSEKTAEALRVWINADKNMDVTLITAFEDPAAWGIVLVDIARHVSRAYEGDGSYGYQAAMDLIRAGFDAEIDHPTDPGRASKMREQ